MKDIIFRVSFVSDQNFKVEVETELEEGQEIDYNHVIKAQGAVFQAGIEALCRALYSETLRNNNNQPLTFEMVNEHIVTPLQSVINNMIQASVLNLDDSCPSGCNCHQE
jgi:hypothetical protein